MQFPSFKEFRVLTNDKEGDVVRYLTGDLARGLRELVTGLKRLKFEDNFDGWVESDIAIAAGATAAIKNRLRGGAVPSMRIIVRGDVNSAGVTDGATAWDQNFVYLRNSGASATVVTVVFLK